MFPNAMFGSASPQQQNGFHFAGGPETQQMHGVQQFGNIPPNAQGPPAACGGTALPGADTNMTTSSIPIHKLPKVRLSECVEFISNGQLDATLTSNLTNQGLATIMWVFSGVRPDMKVTDLRCRTYYEFYMRFARASARQHSTNPQEYQTLINKFLTRTGPGSPLEDQEVIARATEMGFKEVWLKPAKKGKSDAPAQSAAPIGAPVPDIPWKPVPGLDIPWKNNPMLDQSLHKRAFGSLSPVLDQDHRSAVLPTPKKRARTIGIPPMGFVRQQTMALTDSVLLPDDTQPLNCVPTIPAPPSPQQQNTDSCVLCMAPVSDQAASETLSCGHPCHSECKKRYGTMNGKSPDEACPCKSYGNTGVEVTFPFENTVDAEVATEPGEEYAETQIFEAAIASQNSASSMID